MSSLLSTMTAAQKLAPPVRHSDSKSTLAPEHCDVETSSSSMLSSPRPNSTHDSSDDVEGPCSVVVRATFLDVDEGEGLQERFAQLRGRIMSDSALVVCFEIQEPYEPGKFSEAHVQPGPEASGAEDASEAEPAPRESKSAALNESRAAEATNCDLRNQSEKRTTVMLRNVPNNYTREMFLDLLDDQGFAGRYDFVYLPCDFRRQANLGYAFVNLVDASAVEDAWATFDGFMDWALPSQKVCQVGWSGPHQGFKAHVERYRNSPVMHRSVPDAYKPVIFQDGIPQAFPRPTKKIKPPSGC